MPTATLSVYLEIRIKFDQECFANALLTPPEPNEALKRAFN